MAGLFNIYNENTPIRSSTIGKKSIQSQLPQRVKSAENFGTIYQKNTEVHQKKSKGLSIRSNSDLNVTKTSENHSDKIKNKSDEQNKQNTNKNCPIQNQKSKIPTLKSTTEKIKGQKEPIEPKITMNTFVFKKPATPVEKYPEPEKLAYYTDPKELIDSYSARILEADKQFLKRARKVLAESLRNTSTEDEGFISDTDDNECKYLNNSDNHSHSVYESDLIELPNISDEED